MARETLLEDHNSDEEESLSLCDLPIKLVINQEDEMTQHKTITKPPSLEAPHQDFEFGSWGRSVLTESELCAADDVFFQGQILPLRFSVSSDNGLVGFRQDSRNPSRCGSRSDSMEHCSSGGFTTTTTTTTTSLSSRSSSMKSHQSSSSTTTTNSSSSSISATYKPKLVKNNFHSHPSPKPQILNSSSKPRNHVHHNRIGKPTTWGLFRVGLVRTPEIELQDLKLRNSKSFSSSSSSSSSSNNGRKIDEKNNGSKRFEKKKMQRFLFESCKCSVDAVESVSSRIVIIKSSSGGANKKKSSEREIKGEVKEVEEEEEEEKEKEKLGKQKALNHRRTFEWLKELSIADVPDEA